MINCIYTQTPTKVSILVAVLLMVSSVNLGCKPHLFNASPSLPVGWYSLHTADSLDTNDIVLLCLPVPLGVYAMRRGYVHRGSCPGGSRRVGKPVIAMAGDTVHVDSRNIQVNSGPPINAAMHNRDRRGRQMPQRTQRLVLEDHQCFLLSTFNQYSFDSRYFGPIPCHPPFQILRPTS